MQSFARALVGLSLVAAATAYAEPNTDPALTRAQVRADLRIYEESGLYFLDAAETSPWAPVYQSAQQRYEELRSSPHYAQLVQKYASHGADGAGTAH